MADKPKRKPRPRKPVEVELPPSYKGDITASLAKVVTEHGAKREAKIAAGGDPRGPTLLEERDPALVAKVLDLLCHGYDKKRVARECGIEPCTVRDIFKRHIELIGGWRDYMITRSSECGEMANVLFEMKAQMLRDDPELLKKERLVDLAKASEAYSKSILACHGITQAGTSVTVNVGASIEDAIKFQEHLREKLAAAKAEKKAGSIDA